MKILNYLIGSFNFRNALLHSPQKEVLEFGRSFDDISHYLTVIKEKEEI